MKKLPAILLVFLFLIVFVAVAPSAIENKGITHNKPIIKPQPTPPPANSIDGIMWPSLRGSLKINDPKFGIVSQETP